MNRDKLFDHLILSGVLGCCGMGVSFIKEMSANLAELTTSVQELNMRMGEVNALVKDHEQRLRVVEKTKKER